MRCLYEHFIADCSMTAFVQLVLCGFLRLVMRVEKGKSTAEPSLATMSLDKQQTNKQCRAGRDVAGLDGKGAAEGTKGSQQPSPPPSPPRMLLWGVGWAVLLFWLCVGCGCKGGAVEIGHVIPHVIPPLYHQMLYHRYAICYTTHITIALVIPPL